MVSSAAFRLSTADWLNPQLKPPPSICLRILRYGFALQTNLAVEQRCLLSRTIRRIASFTPLIRESSSPKFGGDTISPYQRSVRRDSRVGAGCSFSRLRFG